jgi:hypothetical protein
MERAPATASTASRIFMVGILWFSDEFWTLFPTHAGGSWLSVLVRGYNGYSFNGAA